MTNHPSRARAPYKVRVTADELIGPIVEVPSIARAKARRHATAWDEPPDYYDDPPKGLSDGT